MYEETLINAVVTIFIAVLSILLAHHYIVRRLVLKDAFERWVKAHDETYGAMVNCFYTLNHFHYAWAFDDVMGGFSYKGVWLTHIPIHPDELRGRPNIHGHTHNHIINDNRYLNVCMEQINYRPLEFTEAVKVFHEV